MIDVPVLVKDALREGNLLKEYKFTVYEADGETVDFIITNNKLVSESVKFDERMCSDTNLKFGLCEGTSLEFQAFDIPNITDRRIFAAVRIQYKNENGALAWYEIPMGWFTVEETSRQASTGIRKISAYNRLKSEYLNQSANAEIIDYVSHGEGGSSDVSFYKIIENLLEGYSIEEYKSVDADVTFDNAVGVIQYSIHAKNLNDELIYINLALVASYQFYSMSSPDSNKYGYLDVNVAGMRQVGQTYENRWGNYKVHLRDDTWVTLKYALENDLQIETVNYDSGASYTSPRKTVYGIMIVSDFVNSNMYEITNNIITDDRRLRLFYVNYDFIYTYSEDSSAIRVGNERDAQAFWNNWILTHWDFKAYRLEVPELSYKTLTLEQAMALPDVTLRDLQTSVYETVCQYGKLDRVTDLFSGVELNNSRLYPADNLYPANTLYPNSTSERSNPAMYEKLWADEGNIRSFRYLIITYKGVEQDDQGNLQEVEKKLQRTVDEHGTDDYNMSDNWLFRNLVWDDADIADYADAMVAKMQDITWFPFEMWCAGLPYIETGDELEINMSEGAYTSYVLKRNLKGIQNLQDEMMNGNLDIF